MTATQGRDHHGRDDQPDDPVLEQLLVAPAVGDVAHDDEHLEEQNQKDDYDFCRIADAKEKQNNGNKDHLGYWIQQVN